jgi:Icc-related predicted phosphoesterase
MRNILGIHMDTCLQPRIAKSPLLNVQEILLSRKQRAATNAVSCGSTLLASQSRDQIVHHDFESGQAALVSKVLDDAGINVLDGEAIEVAGVGFAGVAGFGGGFGRRMLNAWGEPLIKQFVQESISHAVRLEQALAKLQTEQRIVVLHYSPIRATLKGEDPEIFAFLGSSRLEEPINRFRVNAVFHGHAHNGVLEGKTSTDIPVYNVSAPALRKTGKPYRIVEL